MDSRPPKRQRRAAQVPKDSNHSEKSESSTLSNPKPVTLLSRPKPTRPRPRAAPAAPAPAPAPSSSPTKPKSSSPSSKPRSLHSFFQPASDGQRWSAQKFEAKRPAASETTGTLDADVIEDDYDSYDEIFTQHIAGDSVPEGQTRTQKPSRTLAKRTTTVRPKSKPSKRFLMPSDSNGGTNKQSKTEALTFSHDDARPWAQRFAPSGLDELAVHKRKVSDVQKWLEDVFEGRRKEVSPA